MDVEIRVDAIGTIWAALTHNLTASAYKRAIVTVDFSAGHLCAVSDSVLIAAVIAQSGTCVINKYCAAAR